MSLLRRTRRFVVEALQAEIAELAGRLGQNSRSSSKPPPSDSPFVKPAVKSLRAKSGRRPGGQPGYPGSTWALVDDPDEQLRHEPTLCTGCGADLGTRLRWVWSGGSCLAAAGDGAGERTPAGIAPLRLRGHLW